MWPYCVHGSGRPLGLQVAECSHLPPFRPTMGSAFPSQQPLDAEATRTVLPTAVCLWDPHGNGSCTFLTETKFAFLGAGPWRPRCCCPDAAPAASGHMQGTERWHQTSARALQRCQHTVGHRAAQSYRATGEKAASMLPTAAHKGSQSWTQPQDGASKLPRQGAQHRVSCEQVSAYHHHKGRQRDRWVPPWGGHAPHWSPHRDCPSPRAGPPTGQDPPHWSPHRAGPPSPGWCTPR